MGTDKKLIYGNFIYYLVFRFTPFTGSSFISLFKKLRQEKLSKGVFYTLLQVYRWAP